MKKISIIVAALMLFIQSSLYAVNPQASRIDTDTSEFNGLLSSSDDTVQKALETIDGYTPDFSEGIETDYISPLTGSKIKISPSANSSWNFLEADLTEFGAGCVPILSPTASVSGNIGVISADILVITSESPATSTIFQLAGPFGENNVSIEYIWGEADLLWIDSSVQIYDTDDTSRVTNLTICESDITTSPYFRLYGYLTTANNAEYIQHQIDDYDDWYHITREDSNILGTQINMPLRVITGDYTNISTEELVVDLSGLLVEGLELSMPILKSTAYSNMSETLPFPYALGVYDRFGIFDKSASGFVEILFGRLDFSDSGTIGANLDDGYFYANWDWCPDEDDTYDIGMDGLRWRDGNFSRNLNLGGKVNTYNGIPTEGYGIPAIVDHVALTGQTADISQNFTNADTAGLYEVEWYLLVTTADAAAGSVILTLGWTDDVGAVTNTTALSTLPLTAQGRARGREYVRLSSGNIGYYIGHTGNYGNAVYALYMTCKKVN